MSLLTTTLGREQLVLTRLLVAFSQAAVNDQ